MVNIYFYIKVFIIGLNCNYAGAPVIKIIHKNYPAITQRTADAPSDSRYLKSVFSHCLSNTPFAQLTAFNHLIFLFIPNNSYIRNSFPFAYIHNESTIIPFHSLTKIDLRNRIKLAVIIIR